MRTSQDRQFAYRTMLLAAGFTGLALLLFARLVFWHLHTDEELKLKPSTAQARELEPARGTITDRLGRPLALEMPRYRVVASPAVIKEPEQVAEELAPLLGMPRQDIVTHLAAQKSYYEIIAADVPPGTAHAVEEANLQGIGVEILPGRYYPMGRLACHVLGFVNIDNQPFYGVEEQYNAALSGRRGSWGTSAVLRPQEVTERLDGADLTLTIEWPIQEKAEALLAEAVADHDATGGTIIVLDPHTGAILAMASWPNFDPNNYASSPVSYYLNPAISQIYEPGSVIKALLMAAAVEEGLIAPDDAYYDTGCVHVMGQPLCNWSKRTYGLTTYTEMLQHSLNVGAIHAVQIVGPERFYRYLEEFGFGHPTGVDLPREVAGIIHRPGDSQWSELVLATNAYGQGMAATPLQVATAMAAIANGGLLIQPYVVERQQWPDGRTQSHSPTSVRRVISQATARTLIKMLVEAVEGGARKARVQGYHVAGKTATSQIATPEGYDEDATIASFAGFGPADAPRFVILVKIDRPREGLASDVAAPVFRDMAAWLFDYLRIPPASGPET